jgi:tRNA-modifying protein YgfZ
MSTWAATAPAGVLRVSGKDRLDLLHRISTNDLRPLASADTTAATVFTNEKGRIVDWVTIVSRPTELWLRTSEGRAPALAAWIDRYTIVEDLTVKDGSAELRHLIVQGDDAVRIAGLGSLPEPGQALAADDAVWIRGLVAYGTRVEALVPTATAEVLLAAMLARGAIRADAAVVEHARLLAGVPSPEHEFKDEVNPLELRINEGVISWTKGCYIGQEVIARLDSYDKLARQLIGFETDSTLGSDAELKLTRDGRPLGRVTSLAGGLGLAVVKREAATPGAAEVVGPAGATKARLVDRPFWTVRR